MFTAQFLAAMIVAGTLPELQCDHDQLVCPLQNITCHCVVTEFTLSWTLDSKLIAQVNRQEKIVLNANYSVTVKVLEDGLNVSSNVSFVPELKSGPVTLLCQDIKGMSTWSYSLVGQFFAILVFLNKSII